jgi:hypothetical protein
MASQNTDCETFEQIFDFEGVIPEYEQEFSSTRNNIKSEHAISNVLLEHLTFNKIEIPKNGRMTIVAFSEMLEDMFRTFNLENLHVEFNSFDYSWRITFGPEFEKRKKVDGEHNWGELTFTLCQTVSSYYLDLIPGGNNVIKRHIVVEIINLLEKHYL